MPGNNKYLFIIKRGKLHKLYTIYLSINLGGTV